MLAAFWSIVALTLTGVIIWLIFTNDETVKRMLKLDDESQAAKAAAAKSAAAASAGAATPGVEESMLDALNKPAAATAAAMVEATESVEPSLESASEQVAVNFTATDPETEGAGVEVSEEAPADPTDAATPEAESPAIEASRGSEIAVDVAADEVIDAEPDVESGAEEAVEIEAADAEPVAPVAVESDDAGENLKAAADSAHEMAEEAAALAGATKVIVSTTDNYPDQLTKLNGIGEVYERRLYEAGIFTWYQISETSVNKLSTITQAIDAANVDDWPGQARRLAADTGRTGVRYSGPMPDKLTAIPGVGPGAQQQLRSHGIVTYHQLSIAPVVKVEAILGDAGKRADVTAIIAKAKELA